jgi:hypothetical protein
MQHKAALMLHYFNIQFIYRVYSGKEALNLYKDILKCLLNCSDILCSVMWCVTPYNQFPAQATTFLRICTDKHIEGFMAR